MRMLFQTILLILFASFHSKSQEYFKSLEKAEAKKGKIVYWEYGLPQFEKEFAREKVATDLGFSFYHVAGCVVTDKTVKRISKHNRRINKILITRIGKNWRDFVDAKADSIYKIDTTLINKFYNSSFGDEYFETLSKSTEHYEIRVLPAKHPNIFYIKIFLLDNEWKVTDKSMFTITSTYPNVSFKKAIE
jgi:hypothetical protein